MRLYCEKLGITAPDDAEYEPEDREHLEWGHTQEPVIADWYERARGVQLQLGGPVYSREHPHFWATLDRTVIGGSRLVEIKNVGSPMLYRHWDTSSPDGVPSYVRGQVTMAMAFHGARECDVVASIGGRPPKVWTVFYDPELAEMMISRAVSFWSLVTTRTPPPLDSTPATRAYLLDKYPENRERVMRVADEAAEYVGKLRAEDAKQAAIHSTAVRRADARLMQLVGDADGIAGDGWSFTWKLNKNGERRSRFTSRGESE
jgi:predicted phage-related endonuclease